MSIGPYCCMSLDQRNTNSFLTGLEHLPQMTPNLAKLLPFQFLDCFFTSSDAKFFASLGLNCIRVPFNYRHFEDDMILEYLRTKGSDCWITSWNIVLKRICMLYSTCMRCREARIKTGIQVQAYTKLFSSNIETFKIGRSICG